MSIHCVILVFLASVYLLLERKSLCIGLLVHAVTDVFFVFKDFRYVIVLPLVGTGFCRDSQPVELFGDCLGRPAAQIEIVHLPDDDRLCFMRNEHAVFSSEAEGNAGVFVFAFLHPLQIGHSQVLRDRY